MTSERLTSTNLAILLAGVVFGLGVAADPWVPYYNLFADKVAPGGMLYLIVFGAGIAVLSALAIWAHYNKYVLNFAHAVFWGAAACSFAAAAWNAPAYSWAFFGYVFGAIVAAPLFAMMFLAFVVRCHTGKDILE